MTICTDMFPEGLKIEKVAKNCALLCLSSYDYLSNVEVSDGSIQIIFFPITIKELNKRFNLLVNAFKKTKKLVGGN